MMVEYLTTLGMHVEVHRDHFQQDDADHNWIPICARNGWVIISGDKGLEKAALNVKAVTDSAAKVFLLTDNNMKGIEWAASIITGRRKMQKIVDENNGPFFATIGKGHDVHVGNLRFVGTGGPKPKQAVTTATVAVPESKPAQPAAEPPAADPQLFH